MEINEKLETTQQDLFMKVDSIQNCYQVGYIALKDVYTKEKESLLARANFQEVVALTQKDNTPNFPQLSPSEKIRDDVALKAWEMNLAEKKRLSREVKDTF